MELLLRDAVKAMKLINEGVDCEAFFEGNGRRVKFIIQEKYVILCPHVYSNKLKHTFFNTGTFMRKSKTNFQKREDE